MTGTNRCPYCWKAPHVEGKEVKGNLLDVRWVIACCGISINSEDLGRAVQNWNSETVQIAAGWVA